MKIFALYFKVELTKKPEWFDEFREKYHGAIGSAPHITLIQPRWVDDADIPAIKTTVAEVLEKHTFVDEDKKIVFDELVSGLEDTGNYVYMLTARRNDHLMASQTDLRDALTGYGHYYAEITREYETRFRPHLTLGNGVPPDQKEAADRYFSSDYICTGVITDLILPVVKDMTPEEADNPNNLTTFEIS